MNLELYTEDDECQPDDWYAACCIASGVGNLYFYGEDTIFETYLRIADSQLYRVADKLHYVRNIPITVSHDSIEDSRILLLKADRNLVKSRKEYQKLLMEGRKHRQEELQ